MSNAEGIRLDVAAPYLSRSRFSPSDNLFARTMPS
jgi:hypothetical protein